jgi:A/G-specific adenine glycosylase
MKQDEISRFRDHLIKWFVNYQRPLPWRQTKDPYHIWVSEVMLQQTQVKKVLFYYQSFIERFPDIRSLAAANLGQVLKSWERMGYYARARNLHKAVRIIAQEMDEKVPLEYDRFRRLPGVGEYIAAAVQSLAFDRPYAVVDGNVRRVIARVFLMDAPINTAASARLIKKRAEEILDRDRPGLFNQAMMELGATICRPGKPICENCPVIPFCLAHKRGQQSQIPRTIRGKPLREDHIVAGIVYKDGRMLITRRKPEGLLGGLWEFPGGKVKPGETPEQACVREIKEEINLSIRIVDFLTQIRHAYTHFKIVMDVFRCSYVSGDVLLGGPVEYRWITRDEIDQFPFPAANHKFIALLRRSRLKKDQGQQRRWVD